MNRHESATSVAQMPTGAGRFLDVRSLADSQRSLAAVLRAGQRVLDVGCGTGAITLGIADAVGAGGAVVGIDVSAELLAQARARGDARVTFTTASLSDFHDERGFDVVTAARVLQWLADPAEALAAMVRLTRPGGQVVVLDYNHCKAEWEPPLPAAGAAFYDAFLRWRAQVGMDNEIADHLGQLFEAAGLVDVTVHDEHEVIARGDADFARRIDLWPSVTATRGHQMVASGMLTEAERQAAETDMLAWAADDAVRQTLVLKAVIGTRPA